MGGREGRLGAVLGGYKTQEENYDGNEYTLDTLKNNF